MCTVSIIRVDSGLRMVANRDEERTRPPALPPTRRDAGARGILAPIDPRAGGTWIAVNDAGLAATVLNGNPPGGPDRREGLLSRGLLVPLVMTRDSVESALREAERVDVSRFPPFRLLIVDEGMIADVRGDGRGLAVEVSRGWDGPVMFASSGLGDHLVQGPRAELFAVMVTARAEIGAGEEAQREFHAHRWADRAHLSVNMTRADARTVSRTVVDVAPDRVSMRYAEVLEPRGEEGPASELWLPRAARASGAAAAARTPGAGGAAMSVSGRVGTASGPGLSDSERRRLRRAAAWARRTRWEFLPTWLAYAPVWPWIALLALRHGSLTVVALSNPGIESGGFLQESKHRIMRRVPPALALPTALVPPGSPEERLRSLRAGMAEAGLSYPVILKPDAGERGKNVRLVRDEAAACRVLAACRPAMVAQRYHPGPAELGVFYCRMPDEPSGRIFSICEKVFPVAVGDGRSSLEEIILRHPRHRMQADVFLERLGPAGAARVPAAGEGVRLAVAGNHCQGAMFVDGARFNTPALLARMDELSHAFGGFCFGRVDVRARSLEALAAGEELGVVEVNGVTSESTNIYDPSMSLLRRYRTLWAQWSWAFRIGAAHRRLGARPPGVREMVRLIREFRAREGVSGLAD